MAGAFEAGEHIQVEDQAQRDELAAAIESIKRSAADFAVMTKLAPPAKPPWWSRAATALLVLVLLLLVVSLAISTYRTLFPRSQPPTPYYVCVYNTEHGTTTVTGSAPCPAPPGQPVHA